MDRQEREAQAQRMKLEELLLGAFHREVFLQCDHAIFAYSLFAETDDIDIKSAVGSRRIWFGVHAFLVACGDLSKLLWAEHIGDQTARKRRSAFCRHLRHTLYVSDTSILKLTPQFRHYWEHLDTELVEWITETERGKGFDLVIGYPYYLELTPGLEVGNMFRGYDPESRDIYFRGLRFETDKVLAEIRELRETTKSEIYSWRSKLRLPFQDLEATASDNHVEAQPQSTRIDPSEMPATSPEDPP